MELSQEATAAADDAWPGAGAAWLDLAAVRTVVNGYLCCMTTNPNSDDQDAQAPGNGITVPLDGTEHTDGTDEGESDDDPRTNRSDDPS